MARYNHLPLFKSAYDFNLYFIKLSRGFPRDFKYGLALEARNLCSAMIDDIILANNKQIKTEYIEEILLAVEKVKIKIRLLRDLGVIKVSSYKFIFESLIDISKQATSWKEWARAGH